MRDLTLTIRDDQSGTDYVYGGARLLIEMDSKDRSVDGLDVNIEDMPLSVGPDASGDPELIGITDPLNLPDRTYRAKLEDGSGSLVMNGAIVARDAIYKETQNAWELVLINQAAEDFWATLGESFLPFPARQSLPVTTTDVQCYVKDRPLGENYLQDTRTFYQPREILQLVLDRENITYDMPARLWEYDVEYESASRTVTSEDLRISLGTRNARTLVEEIAKMAGWRTQISYQSWPSRDLHVDFLPTDWPLPAAQQVLDSDLSEESYALSLQKNVQNWGLELRNGADESSPDPTAESYNSGPIPSFGVPPAYGALAPERWVTPPRESPERRVLADTVQTKFRVPPIAVEEEPDILSGTESVAIGPVRLVVGEDGINKQEELLVFEVYQSPSDSNWYAVHSRYPQPPEYDGSKTVGHMPGWASAPYERQVLRRASQRKLEGDFIDIGEQPVGDPAHLVEMLGKKWMPFESKREVGRLLSTIVMQRPTAVTTEPARGTIPESLPWQITNPKGEYRTLDRGNGQEDWVLLHWERTPIAEAVELWYNVELKDTTASSPSFFTVAEVNEATFSTAATYQAKSAGSGGASYSDGDIVARVRPVKGLDRVSGRNVPVAGDWLQFDVRAA